MLEFVFGWLEDFEGPGLLILFIALLACGLGLPLPEDITLVAGGIMVSNQLTTFRNTVLVCMLGILLGDAFVYWVGRLWGGHLFKSRLLARFVSGKLLTTGEKAFNRFGDKIIFIARFLPGMRTPIFFFCGHARISFHFFLLVDGFAALISAPVWVYVGKIFGDNLPALEKAVKELQAGTLILVALFVILLVGAYFIKNWIRKALGT